MKFSRSGEPVQQEHDAEQQASTEQSNSQRKYEQHVRLLCGETVTSGPVFRLTMKAEIALNVTESILRLAEWVLILKNPEGMYLFELSTNIINVEVKCSKSTSG